MGILKAIFLLIRAFLVPRLHLAAENLAPRIQALLAMLLGRAVSKAELLVLCGGRALRAVY